MHQIFGYSNCSQNKRNSNLDVHLNFQAEAKKFHILEFQTPFHELIAIQVQSGNPCSN
jgi:hypothetical protein